MKKKIKDEIRLQFSGLPNYAVFIGGINLD